LLEKLHSLELYNYNFHHILLQWSNQGGWEGRQTCRTRVTHV